MQKLVWTLFLLLGLCVLFTAIAKAQEFEPNAYLVFDTSRDDWYPKTNLVADWPMLDAGAGLDQTLGKGDMESWQGATGGCTNCPTGFTCTCTPTSNINKETTHIFKNSNCVASIADAVPNTNELAWTQTYRANYAYQISFWYKGAVGGIGESLSVTLRNAAANDFYVFSTDTWQAAPTSLTLGSAPAAWTRVVAYVKVGVADKASYKLTFEGSSASQTIYIDNLQIQKLHALGPTSSVGAGVTLLPAVTADPLFTQTPYGTMKQGPSTPYPWGMTLDGTNDYVSCTDAVCGAWADPPASFSVGCYQVIPNAIAGVTALFYKYSALVKGWFLQNNGGTAEAYVYKAGAVSSSQTIASCFAAYQAASAVMTYQLAGDGASILSLYCNNSSTSTAAAVGPVIGNNEALVLGANSAGAGAFFSGSIGRCAFWNRALTATEAKAYTYPYFQPNTNGTTTYVRACTQAVPEATCWQDKCRNAKADTCEVEPTGVFGSFLANTEILRDNSLEAYTFAVSGDGTFGAKADYSTGTSYGIATGDLNGDGYDDIVATKTTTNSARVLINDGDGTFAAVTNYGVNGVPYDVALGEFRFAGRKDIVVVGNNLKMSVLLGNGDGTFAAKVDYNCNGCYGVATGDFNGDGKDDIAVSRFAGDKMGIFINNGLGVFAAPIVEYASGVGPYDIAVGDFRNTGVKDIVTANYTDGSISVFLGVGDGTFGAKTDYAAGGHCWRVATGDTRGTGVIDIAATNNSDDDMSVFLGVGDGSFGAKTDYATGSGAYGIAFGDFRNTGKYDIVVDAYNDNKINVFLGDGLGGFAAKVEYVTDLNPLGVAVGDFRNNNVNDIAASTFNGNTSVFLADYITADDSNSTLTRWTKVETGGGDVTTYHANNRHGLTTVRLKTVGAGTAGVTSTCQTVGVGSDLFVYASVNKLSSTTDFSIELNEFSDGACATPISTTAVKSTSNLFSRWQTVTKHLAAADWDGATNSYTLTFKETGTAAITKDILLDTVSAKAQKYYTPWVENPSGSVTTTVSTRVFSLDNPLAQGTPAKYTAGFCVGGWVWTDWGGSTMSAAIHTLISVPASAGVMNKWSIYGNVLAGPQPAMLFDVYDQNIGGHYHRIYNNNINDTNWSAHSWKYVEACFKPSLSSPLTVIKAKHYNSANLTWYDWLVPVSTSTQMPNGQSTTLSIGHALGVSQPDAYFYKPFIVPYSATYPDTFFNNGKLPPLPYGSFNND